MSVINPGHRELLVFASCLRRGPPAAPPVTNEKGDRPYAEQQHRNRSQAIRFELGEISEGILGRIGRIVKDRYLLSAVGFFLPWAFPPAVGFTTYRKAVPVPVVICRFVGGDSAICGLFPLGDRPVDDPFVDCQDYA